MAWTRKLPSGRWQALYRDPSGRVKSYKTPDGKALTFQRRGDAKEAAAEEESKIRRRVWTDPKLGSMGFATYCEQYMGGVLHHDPATLDRDRSLLTNHLLPHLGALPLSAIDTARVRAWVGQLAVALSPSTVALAYQLLARIMRQAQEDKLIINVPARVRLPRDTRDGRADRWLSAPELEMLADEIAPRYRALILTMGYMGLRFGEAAGLTRRYVDIPRSTLEVAQSLQERSGHLELKEPKTDASRRKLPLPAFLVAELAEHLRLYGDHPEHIFSGREGAPLRKTWVRRHFRPAAERAGLLPLRPHHLRHTAVSLLIAEGAHAKEIQEWCGHSSFAITMDVYGHMLPERHEKLAERLDAIHDEASKSATVTQIR